MLLPDEASKGAELTAQGLFITQELNRGSSGAQDLQVAGDYLNGTTSE